MALILVVGAADMGRAPLVAGLLRRTLAGSGTAVEIGSAGVLDHTGDEMEPQAQLALEHLGGVPAPHQARLLTAELAEAATVLLAVDRGTGRVVAARHPQLIQRLLVLSELAHDRDVPDPFHMTLDKWIVFGRALQEQLQKAMPTLLRQLGEPAVDMATPPPAAPTQQPAPGASAAPQPAGEAIQQPGARLRRLLLALEAAPEIVDWDRGRRALGETLTAIGAQAAPGDMAPAVVALLHGLLAQQEQLPSPGQVAWLATLAPLLEQPIDAPTMARVATEATTWATR